MHTPGQLLEIINREIEQEDFSGKPAELFDPIRYTLDLGGKRIRPVMVLMACELFGGNIADAMPAALGIEMFHNFSLVHDDIMDRAPIRRGKPAVYVKWDPNTAILSGDAMLTMAYDYFLKLNDARQVQASLEMFSRTAREVCMGQQMDLNFETQTSVTVHDYLEMIRLKTAVLLGASLYIGGIIGGAEAEDLKFLYNCGIANGISFQLRDDLLDVYAEKGAFGKRPFGDIMTNKKTFLYLTALEQASTEIKEELTGYYADTSLKDDEKVRKVLGIFNKLDVKKITENKILEFHHRAIKDLESVSIGSDKKSLLHDYTAMLAGRSY